MKGVNLKKYALIPVLWGLFFGSPMALSSSTSIEVVGLFNGSAILMINGTQRLVKQGKTSPEGIEVVEANSKFVRIKVEGEEKKLSLSKKITTKFVEADDKSEVRISKGDGGHYLTPGRINNRPCYFLVDTGATYVSLNSNHAAALGITYTKGEQVLLSTANGVKKSYRIKLDSVAVGTVKVYGVTAVVSEGDFPGVILLGNAYLGQVEMKVDAGVLVLQSKI